MSEPNTTEQTPPPAEAAARTDKQVILRYGRMGNIGLFAHEMETPPPAGAKLVVRTERGTELATVLINVSGPESVWRIEVEALESFLRACGNEYPFTRGGRVLRPAAAQDRNDQQHLDSSSHEELLFGRQEIRALNVQMRIVCVEHLLGGERIIFFFTAENRVDFRELVRRLAARYHTRVEMRQVGARDEARLVADYERCGRRCCCQEYMKFLQPVSMKMAKTQKATLDPAKISGRCGRLMCCLRYEDETYEQLQKTLPRRNSFVRTTAGVVGKVLDCQILTQLVRLLQPNLTQLVVPVDEIAERDVAAPPPPQPSERERRYQAAQEKRGDRRKLSDEPAAQPMSATSETPQADQPADVAPTPPPAEPSVEAAAPQTPAEPVPAGTQPPAPGQGEAKRRHRNRRRRRKPSSGASGQNAAPPPAQPQGDGEATT